MSTKRVILANSSRLLREMFHHVIDKADNLEVVLDTPNQEELPSQISRLAPEWVILSLPYANHGKSWINTCTEDYPSVGFILLSPDNHNIKMKAQRHAEEDLTNLSLRDFIQILETDLQPT